MMSELLTVDVIKCHGTSNDFFVLDETAAILLPDPLKSAFTRLVSNRQGGLGADGVVFISAFDDHHPRMRFFNPDGSEAEMCGNGLRCAARACFEGHYKGQNPILFKTLGGDFKTENFFSEPYQLPFVRVTTDVLSTNPENILASRTRTPFLAQPFAVGAQTYVGTILSVGNPHLIVPVADLHAIDLMGLGHALENHPMFLNRANVSFVQVIQPHTILVQTYERGVGLTLACGTGMLASVVAQVLNGTVVNQEPVMVHTAGGIVWVTPSVTEGRLSAQLTGNATWVYRGKIPLRIQDDTLHFASPTVVEKEQVYTEEAAQYAKLASQTLFDRAILKGTSLEQGIISSR
ncbi:MAG: diaminopimelate epimerase [Magnetococcales bacterium]|nr:diaminopimelate epimerase [Magnetococcales bacterium]